MFRNWYLHALGLLLLEAAGCGPRVEFMQYRGVQDWPVGSAFVRVVSQVELYEGLPDRPYEVVGLIDIYFDQPFFFNQLAVRDVLKHVRENRADAVLWLSKRLVMSGSLRMSENQPRRRLDRHGPLHSASSDARARRRTCQR